MGTDIEVQALIHSRIQAVEKLLDRIFDWDGTMESGIHIIDENQLEIIQLKDISQKLSFLSIDPRDEEQYKNKLSLLLSEQSKMFQVLKKEQDFLLKGMLQLNKRDHVMNSYISTKSESVFVDKDV